MTSLIKLSFDWIKPELMIKPDRAKFTLLIEWMLLLEQPECGKRQIKERKAEGNWVNEFRMRNEKWMKSDW